jgi:AcrR family transcriptional regulator
VRQAKAARAHISEPRLDRMARRNPSQGRSRQTVDAIVEAAAQLLVEHGRAGVTTNAVAERAGVSIGSLYQYFPNKEAIFASLQERHRDQVVPLIQHTMTRLADPGVDMVDAMVGLMRAMAELHVEAPERLQAISRELREEIPAPDLQAFSNAMTKLLAARFSRTEDSVRPMAWLTCETLANVGRTLVHRPPALNLDRLLEALADMLRGLFATLYQRW